MIGIMEQFNYSYENNVSISTKNWFINCIKFRFHNAYVNFNYEKNELFINIWFHKKPDDLYKYKKRILEIFKKCGFKNVKER